MSDDRQTSLAVLVPFKGFAASKSRLAQAPRESLARAMLENVTNGAARSVGAGNVHLVAPDDPELRAWSDERGFTWLRDTGTDGLNGAVAGAAEQLAAAGYQRVLVLHADLPLATVAAIERLIATGRATGAAMIRDAAGKGTKGLFLPIPMPFRPSFGEDSAGRHAAAAVTAGIDLAQPRIPELAIDLNTSEDLARLAAFRRAGWPVAPALAQLLDTIDASEPPAGAFDWLADFSASELAPVAASIRDAAWGRTMTYSRKVFVPLTRLCRDVCHYCTFATRPSQLEAPYLTIEEVLGIARAGKVQGCKEALFTLGDRPESRYADARAALDRMGYETTLDYVAAAAEAVVKETGLLPHVNAGVMTAAAIARLRPWMGSAGLMLESGSMSLCAKGGPHYGSPDKLPARRMETLHALGAARVPTTTGLLIGIGESRTDRLRDLVAIAGLHRAHGHVQEVILQNFRAKPGTLMAGHPDADPEELLWTIAAARMILPAAISLQAPPNLNPGATAELIRAGIDDWGGISPVTPDHVNPEAPWPEINALAGEIAAEGRALAERLTLRPEFVRAKAAWCAPGLHAFVDRLCNGAGLARADDWTTGRSTLVPSWVGPALSSPGPVSPPVALALDRVESGRPGESDLVTLFGARGVDLRAVLGRADRLRREVSGDDVTYVINRNINYTNICYFNCRFCGFSKGKTHEHLRGKPYVLGLDEIRRRVREAAERGATEVCLQGGIHPDYTGRTYLDICAAIRSEHPEMHIHAFSPLEIAQGARTLGVSVRAYLGELIAAGLGSLPGTAAEILDDEVRQVLCHDKLTTAEWFDVVETAHDLGLRTTSTIMFGHIDGYHHWARHLLRLRDSALRTGGYTEFVPLPFVAHEAPMVLKGQGRLGPTFREVLLMHAVARLTLHPAIPNIQASWVKLGAEGVRVALRAGVNDLGGTLMDETITRSSGGAHGPEMTAERLEDVIRAAGRQPRRRTTLYGSPHERMPGE